VLVPAAGRQLTSRSYPILALTRAISSVVDHARIATFAPLFLWKEEVAPLSLRSFRAISSVVERLLHTQEVAGSNPASRTIFSEKGRSRGDKSHLGVLHRHCLLVRGHGETRARNYLKPSSSLERASLSSSYSYSGNDRPARSLVPCRLLVRRERFEIGLCVWACLQIGLRIGAGLPPVIGWRGNNCEGWGGGGRAAGDGPPKIRGGRGRAVEIEVGRSGEQGEDDELFHREVRESIILIIASHGQHLFSCHPPTFLPFRRLGSPKSSASQAPMARLLASNGRQCPSNATKQDRSTDSLDWFPDF
jgi:hypothetical protein